MKKQLIGSLLDIHQDTISSGLEKLQQKGLVQLIGDQATLTAKGEDYMKVVKGDWSMPEYLKLHG